MTNFLPLLLCCLLAVSCKDEIRRPLPEAAAKAKPHQNAMAAMLPVHIDSTNYLLHPVGDWGRDSEGYFSSGSSSGTSVFSAADGLHGKISNISFQKIGEEEFVPLTENPVLITSVEFLRPVFENIGKGFLLYKVFDRDNNEDGAMDGNDVLSLYISGIDGEHFNKLTADDQNFLEYTIIEKLNRVYFRTYEDLNEDKKLGKEDRVHLFYLELSAEAPRVVEYDPRKS